MKNPATFGKKIDFAALGLGLLFITLYVAPQIEAYRTASLETASLTPAVFSNLASWHPLAEEVAKGNLLPGSAQSGLIAKLSVYPYLTLWFHGALIFLFGAHALWVGKLLCAFVAFVSLYGIFRRHLPELWSFSLTALSLVCSTGFSFRAFLARLLDYRFSQPQTVFELELLQFPIPAVSIALFLAVLHFTLKRRSNDTRGFLACSFLWALQTQIHVYNAMVGIPLWILLLVQHCRRARAKTPILPVLASNLAVIGLVCAPWIAGFLNLNAAPAETWLTAQQARTALPPLIDYFYNLAYFVIPLVLLGGAFFIQRIDTFELYGRFSFVMFLILIEVALAYASHFFFSDFTANLMFSRIFIFLHFLYLTPFVHFLSRPGQDFWQRGSESSGKSVFLRKAIHFTLTELNRSYLPVILFALLLFSLQFAPGASVPGKKLALLERGTAPGDIVAADDPVTNLLIAAKNGGGGLWLNRFNNDASTGEVIRRLALFGKISGWDEDSFVKFMQPGFFQKTLINDRLGLTRENLPDSGIGYWLVFQKRQVTSASMPLPDEAALAQAYRNVDPAKDLKDLRVRKILLTGDKPAGFPYLSADTAAFGTVYTLY